MDHVAIMDKKWKLIPKILSGEKYIESRWYVTKRAPWNKVFAGDKVYFKNAGEMITACATVEKVLQFDNLDVNNCQKILDQYKVGIQPVQSRVDGWAAGKKYCVLIFLKNPQEVTPFGIDKKGFGISSAWLCCSNIRDITISF